MSQQFCYRGLIPEHLNKLVSLFKDGKRTNIEDALPNCAIGCLPVLSPDNVAFGGLGRRACKGEFAFDRLVGEIGVAAAQLRKSALLR